MKWLLGAFTISTLVLASCNSGRDQIESAGMAGDSLSIMNMIRMREEAMINSDISSAMSQFSEDVTWINSQGYYFQGKPEVLNFHKMLNSNDSLDYYYEAGLPLVRMLDDQNALAYYSWKMFWFRRNSTQDTVNREVGLMTLSARKIDKEWKWVAITNQHTPWFYDSIEPVFIE